jgi:hypothetical protein
LLSRYLSDAHGPHCSGCRNALITGEFWSEWQDLNLRPPRPERQGIGF